MGDIRDDQLALPGVPPAIQKRGGKPRNPPHLPTKADAEALRKFVLNDTCEPGATPPSNFDQLAKTKAKLTYTAEERKALLDLADRWENG